MHYNDPEIRRDQILKLVVYKHESGEMKNGEDGLLSRQSVQYEVTSIRHCYCIRPDLLADIISVPFKYFNKHLSALPFERFYQIILNSDEHGHNVQDIQVRDVTEEKDQTYFLH